MNDTNDDTDELLFSYGTLQDPSVQLSTFGHILAGEEDELEGYTLTMLEVTDAATAAGHREGRHPTMVLTGQPEDLVAGTLFRISPQELRQADTVEAADYRRDRIKLASGHVAWAYVDARPVSYEPDGSSS